MEILRYDTKPGLARVVVYNGIAYFTGHVAAGAQPTLKEQGEALLKRYDELFLQFGFKKENILTFHAYAKDISEYDEFRKVFRAWLGDVAPAGVAVQAPCSSPEYLIELELMVAVG